MFNNLPFKIFSILILFLLTSYNAESRIADTIEALQEKLVIKKHLSKLLNLLPHLGHCAKFHNDVFPKIKKEYIDWKDCFYI